MKLIPTLATASMIAVTQIRSAIASLNDRQVSLTSPDTPTLTPISTSDTTTSTGTLTPTISSSPFVNVTSVGTETLIGPKPSATIGGSLTESLSVTSPNAAETPFKLGAGVLVGVLGVVGVL